MSKRDESKLPKTHYYSSEYLKRERLYSYVEQIELVKRYTKSRDKILEIGKGNGFLYRFLKEYLKIEVECVDINPELTPDIVDNIISPKKLIENSFDIVTCYEVVEHMHFEDSVRSIQNICKVGRKYCLVSVPDMRYFINLNGTVFGSLPVSFGKMLSTGRLRNKSKTFGKDHYWEIGITVNNQKYDPHFVRNNLFQELNVISDYRCNLVPWHHYYVIKL